METPVRKQAHGAVVIEDNIIECPLCEHGIIVDNVKKATVRRNSVICSSEPTVVGDGVELISD